MPGYFALKPSGSQFMFNLKAENHQTILTSERYESKQNAQRGIESVRVNCRDDARYERRSSKASEPYFALTSTNGQTIRLGEMYSSTSATENGIESCKRNGSSLDEREQA